jgi:hypothetical protein
VKSLSLEGIESVVTDTVGSDIFVGAKSGFFDADVDGV